MAVKLPNGFVLDAPTQNSQPNLPPGFVLDAPSGNVENPVNIRIPGPSGQSYSPQELSTKIIPQLVTGLQQSPIGGLAQKLGIKPYIPTEQVPSPQGVLPNLARLTGNIGGYTAAASPFIGAAEMAPAIPPLVGLTKLVEAANSPLGRTALGIGGLEGTMKVAEGKPLEAPGAALAGAGLTYAGGKTLEKVGKGLYEAPGAIKNYLSEPARVARYGKALKIAEPVIKGINKYGIRPIQEAVQNLGGNVKVAADTISQRINDAFTAKSDAADEAFKQAMSNVPIGYKDRIDIGPVRSRLIGIIRRYKGLGKADPQIQRLSSLLQDMSEATSTKMNKNLTKAQRAQISITGMSKQALSKEVLVNKDTFSAFRDVLSRLYKETGRDKEVFSLIDKMYQAGEKSGLEGLGKARALFRAVRQAEELFPKSLYSEKSLQQAASTMSKENFRKLQSLEKFLGIKFVEDAEKVSLGTHVQKITDAIKSRTDKIKKIGAGVALTAMGAGGVKSLIH